MIDPQIIKYAADTSNYGLQKKSKYIAISKNKVCGDRITVELKIDRKVIKKMCYETESCVYCQASASLLSKSVRNQDVGKIFFFLENEKKNKRFKELLKNKERFSCVMLPFVALQKAVNNSR